MAARVVGLALGLFALYLALRLLLGPLRPVLAWVLRGALGAALIWLLDWPLGYLGWHVGVNAWTALVSAALGLPGVALLFALQALLG